METNEPSSRVVERDTIPKPDRLWVGAATAKSTHQKYFSIKYQVPVKRLSRRCRRAIYCRGSTGGLTTMDGNLKKLLDELPGKPPRSRLLPYSEFIEKLRSRGRTYRDIAEILGEKCALQVTGSGVHDFIRTDRGHGLGRPMVAQLLRSEPVVQDRIAKSSSDDDVHRRIKERPER